MGTIKLGSLATGHSIEGMDSTEDPEKKLQSSKEVRGKPEENEVTDIERVKRQFPEKTYQPQQNPSKTGAGIWQFGRWETISKIGICLPLQGFSMRLK